MESISSLQEQIALIPVTCRSQIKRAEVTQPLLNHVPPFNFQQAAIAHRKESLYVLLALLSGGGGMAKGTMPDRG